MEREETTIRRRWRGGGREEVTESKNDELCDEEEKEMFAKLSYLGKIWLIQSLKIKPEKLLKYQKLRFVTCSIEKRLLSLRVSSDQREDNNNGEEEEEKKLINPAVAYRIAASAASRLFSHSKTVLPFGSSKRQENEASLLATADSVSAKEQVKQAVTDDLKSNRSPPCE